MKLLKLRKRTKCPKKRIVIVYENALSAVYSWHFGPDTRNPWPDGDYYSEGAYNEPASMDYHGFADDGDFREYQEHPPEMLVDIGL